MASNTTPFEIIAGPANVWIAPVATSFPAVDAVPSGTWVSLGRTEGGVQEAQNQKVNLLMVDQASGPVKAIRAEEGNQVTFDLAELTLERWARVLNGQTVTTVAAGSGTAGYKVMNLHQGHVVQSWAMLIRGLSPYSGDDNAHLQWELPVVVQDGQPKPKFIRTDKTVLATQWSSLEDPTQSAGQEFGVLRAYNAAPL